MNPAASLLGPLYELYVAALGDTVGNVVGYVTLIGIIALVWWCVNNRDDLISGFDLRLATIGHAVILIILTIVIYVVASDNLGFPFLGSITVAVSTALFCRWTMNTLEGELV